MVNLNGSQQNATGSTRSGQGFVKRNTVKSKLSVNFQEYGYVVQDGKPIPPEYLVRITSFRNKCTVVAPLQEAISLNVESIWEPLVPTSILKTANLIAQATSRGERSAITSATTRRLWSGTSPISIVLRLKFESVLNTFNEVVEPGRLLQTMALPSDPFTDRKGVNVVALGTAIKSLNIGKVKDEISNFPALRPPGPTPFIWENLLGNQTSYLERSQSDVDESRKGGDFIMIEIGTFLTFWNVIVREGAVVYDIKFDKEGLPISASTEIRFETYEMPTKESLTDSYLLRSSSENNRAITPGVGPISTSRSLRA